MLSIGIVGETPRNGHPFSFSAILNGFDSDKIRKSGWGLIADYLEAGSSRDIGNLGARATHVWFPDAARAELLCEATGVDKVAESFDKLVDAVDAVMILRDDWRNNSEMALRALRLGKPVFVDKPLSLSLIDLHRFEPFLHSGKLMSSSGLRFSLELEKLQHNQIGVQNIDAPVLLVAKGPSDWEHNALHLLEPSVVVAKALGFSPPEQDFLPPTQMIDKLGPLYKPLATATEYLERRDSALEERIFFASAKLVFALELSKQDRNTSFQVEFFVGEKVQERFQLRNRLVAFRGLLTAFVSMATTGIPAVDPEETMWCLRRALEGQRLLEQGATSKLH